MIARQLNDDVHDWREDLRAGRITYVLAVLLRNARLSPGEYSLDELIAKLERLFWDKTLPYICRRIFFHVKLSRQALKPIDILRDENYVVQLLDKIEASVNQTKTTILQARRFLQAYTGRIDKS